MGQETGLETARTCTRSRRARMGYRDGRIFLRNHRRAAVICHVTLQEWPLLRPLSGRLPPGSRGESLERCESYQDRSSASVCLCPLRSSFGRRFFCFFFANNWTCMRSGLGRTCSFVLAMRRIVWSRAPKWGEEYFVNIPVLFPRRCLLILCPGH